MTLLSWFRLLPSPFRWCSFCLFFLSSMSSFLCHIASLCNDSWRSPRARKTSRPLPWRCLPPKSERYFFCLKHVPFGHNSTSRTVGSHFVVLIFTSNIYIYVCAFKVNVQQDDLSYLKWSVWSVPRSEMSEIPGMSCDLRPAVTTDEPAGLKLQKDCALKSSRSDPFPKMRFNWAPTQVFLWCFLESSSKSWEFVWFVRKKKLLKRSFLSLSLSRSCSWSLVGANVDFHVLHLHLAIERERGGGMYVYI